MSACMQPSARLLRSAPSVGVVRRACHHSVGPSGTSQCKHAALYTNRNLGLSPFKQQNSAIFASNTTTFRSFVSAGTHEHDYVWCVLMSTEIPKDDLCLL